MKKEDIIRNKIRQIIKENYQEELIDMILDKISKYGEKSLQPHEKDLLNRISTGKEVLKNDLDLVFDFLDFNLGELTSESYVQNKLGKKVSGIKYFDKQNNFVFDLEIDSEVLGMKKETNTLYADDDLLKFLQHNFTINDSTAKEVIKRWFEKTTGEKISKIEFWMSGE
jgi:hypothetical protein